MTATRIRVLGVRLPTLLTEDDATPSRPFQLPGSLIESNDAGGVVPRSHAVICEQRRSTLVRILDLPWGLGFVEDDPQETTSETAS